MLSPDAQRRRSDAATIWQAGVAAVRPEVCLPPALANELQPLKSTVNRILVVGAGKAGGAMAKATEDLLFSSGFSASNIAGWVNIPEGANVATKAVFLHPARPQGVNFPTEAVVAGTKRILKLFDAAGEDTLMICLLSGGGSALLCEPVDGVSLTEKQEVTKLLHGCGATIHEMNCVRKHISTVKGGRLAQRFLRQESPLRRLLSLVISDVMGDPLDVIASGPTVPDPTTFAEAIEVLEKYKISADSPPAVLHYLQAGACGQVPETWKPESDDGRNTVRITANSSVARTAAVTTAQKLGYRCLDLGDLEGDTTKTAKEHAELIQKLRAERLTEPLALISGGETTVQLGKNPGKGGRNQEFVLAAALAIQLDRIPELTLLSGGTDGEDGPTDAAGAWLDAERWQEAIQSSLQPLEHLNSHNSYPFFESLGCLLKTGLSQTNVMDLRVSLLATEA